MKCPVCSSNSNDQELVFIATCGRFDGSTLYKELQIVKCNKCQHFFNLVSGREVKGLAAYYKTEYAEANFHSVTDGDLPGSSNTKSLERYNQLYDVLKDYIKPKSMILDVGCALGGFLNFLEGKGYLHLRGIDSNEAYVNKSDRNISCADATDLPYGKNTINCIVMDQVLEHLVNPAKAIREAYRVLTKEGVLCVAVPNINEYYPTEPIPGFWYIMREHLQHFSIGPLWSLCYRNGFDLRGFKTVKTPISERVFLPNLIAVFKKIDMKPAVYFLDHKSIDKIKSTFEKAAAKMTPVYCWGIGREFFFAYETLGLKNCNIVGLIDSNPYKQTLTVDGMKISGPEILREKVPGSVIYVAAHSHKESIKKQISEMGLK